ncbi:MAG TPA: SET domain-containing protein-lysine N-methyltransferase [Rudaea sp.]|nr:SET domain-containing protein-lysine N-methyltransferase [Rudaea sp.]
MTRRIIRRQSPIHGSGVFAARDIAKGTTIIEYRGRRLTHAQANRRYANDTDSGHTFLFTLNEKYVIDGGDGGNVARWINHSCAPNCQAWIVESGNGDGRKDRVVIESRRAIRAGEELTYDYGITLEERQTPALKKIWACRCGAARCTGTLLKPKSGRRGRNSAAAR